MNHKHFHGLAVASIADAEKLGTVEQAYLDPAGKRLAGFTVNVGGGGVFPFVAVADVRALGPDALMLADRSALHEDAIDRVAGLLEVGALTKRAVVTEGGTNVGQVAAAEFDEQSFGLTQIEASPGFFKTNKPIPVDQIVGVGADLVVVADAVVAEPAAAAEAAAAAIPTSVVVETSPVPAPMGADTAAGSA